MYGTKGEIQDIWVCQRQGTVRVRILRCSQHRIPGDRWLRLPSQRLRSLINQPVLYLPALSGDVLGPLSFYGRVTVSFIIEPYESDRFRKVNLKSYLFLKVEREREDDLFSTYRIKTKYSLLIRELNEPLKLEIAVFELSPCL